MRLLRVVPVSAAALTVALTAAGLVVDRLDAAGVARSHALHVHLARAALGYGGQWTFTGETVDDTLVALLEEALDALGDADDALRARLLARLANELYHSDRPERAARHSERAVEAARASGDPTALGQALLARLYALWRPVGGENLDERARHTSRSCNWRSAPATANWS